MPFQKGHKLATGRPEGSKNKVTLLKEERRAIFDKRISEKWEETIDKLRPEYIADQFMGTAEKKLDITTQGEKIVLPPDKVAKINEIALDESE